MNNQIASATLARVELIRGEAEVTGLYTTVRIKDADTAEVTVRQYNPESFVRTVDGAKFYFNELFITVQYDGYLRVEFVARADEQAFGVGGEQEIFVDEKRYLRFITGDRQFEMVKLFGSITFVQD